MEMKATGWSWDESVYTGIRQFHEAKGFHPDGQNVARELGYKLYKISTELDGPFARIQTIDVCDDRTETQETADGSEQPVHAESDLITSPIQKGLPRANDVETSGPSNYWKIIIGVQFAVILTLGALWWYDRFHY
ncbi:hypothetical protein B0H17DRAFT_389605 [Mycena rosella]|uniref:Uncharacterized protein n=1 Tax=Mycena rosella TaxID=1033263 RepID=A0AAD7CMS7_MYCRO|nr:hypothetical protein B0H17DRAFT_389605 [Mycena rosella]